MGVVFSALSLARVIDMGSVCTRNGAISKMHCSVMLFAIDQNHANQNLPNLINN